MIKISANQWNFLSNPDKYVKASIRQDRPLAIESTTRQFSTARNILERLNGSFGDNPRRGILLADDVGLGKTTVAALVAWVVASAGGKRRVRILAPNEVMKHRWRDELLSHVEPLQVCAPKLGIDRKWVKGNVDRLSAGSIQVVKHSYAASDFTLKCDLLIVDEAHRAKGENSAFSVALKQQMKRVSRILILTATPFSIRLEELERMLILIGGGTAQTPVRSYSHALDNLFGGNTARDQKLVAAHLSEKAKAAVEALSSFVIRNGIEDLPKEINNFGKYGEWKIPVPHAKPEEVELMVRMDRVLRVSNSYGSEESKATNDPRFHVGWRHFDVVRKRLMQDAKSLKEPGRNIVESQLQSIAQLRQKVGVHSKMTAVATAVKSKIEQGEKVVLFCHHHATAQELTVYLDSVLDKLKTTGAPIRSAWKHAWSELLLRNPESKDEPFRDVFINWLCEDLVRTQTWCWVQASSHLEINLIDTLKSTKCRHLKGPETIADSANHLYHALLQSKSSRSVLKAVKDEFELLPGANGTSRVLGVCKPSDNPKEKLLFLQNKQPDTIISIFNSPFGPDVLIVTDKLSEGIDLHRYCRHLIHYELDPSPIRTVQRNGRIRRVNSWAALTKQSILYAYPSFIGTRDHKLVQIMKNRIGNFSLLLGGVNDFDTDEVVGSEEEWRNNVIEMAKNNLGNSNAKLCG